MDGVGGARLLPSRSSAGPAARPDPGRPASATDSDPAGPPNSDLRAAEDVIRAAFAIAAHLLQDNVHAVDGSQGGPQVLLQRRQDMLDELHARRIPPVRRRVVPVAQQRFHGAREEVASALQAHDCSFCGLPDETGPPPMLAYCSRAVSWRASAASPPSRSAAR